MPSNDILFTFLVATAVFAYMPGPSTLYAATQTLVRGRQAGWLAALGIHVGGYVHILAAALGISALFMAVPLLYSIIKITGACYLVWLGIQLYNSKEHLSELVSDVDTAIIPRRTFWQSITVEVLNPKTAIFYLAFLPQFTEPSAALPLWGQLLILGTFVNIMFSSADVLCVVLSSTLVKYFKQAPVGSRIVQRVGGGILVGLGIKLALTPQ